MSQRSKLKATAREARQARQARRIINGIFIGLIVLMIVVLVGYYLVAG
ncbi:MAG TPA: hypothetical protein IAC71_06490 [Candidatus Caccomonas pullistercoris]|nr:hypothetical protein [Candidatus Caccomonas pullistercoris]